MSFTIAKQELREEKAEQKLVKISNLKYLGKSTYHFTLGAAATIPFTVFLVAVQSPIYLYRLLLTKFVAPLHSPRIGNAVTINGQFFATEFLRSKQSCHEKFRYGVVVTIILKGDVSRKEVSDLIMERWIKRKIEDDSQELRYPEFQQYIEKWMGFMFWKQDFNFYLNKHIFSYDLDKHNTPEKSKEFINQLAEKLLNEPFPLQTSPWQAHLIRNYKCDEVSKDKNMTALIIRFHHAMADGPSFTHALVHGLFEDGNNNGRGETVRVPIKKKTENTLTKKNISNQFWDHLLVPFRFMAGFGFIASLPWNRQFPWTYQPIRPVEFVPGKKSHDAKRSQIYQKSPLIPLEKLKFIKNRFGVPLSAVLFSGLSSALAKSLPATTRPCERIMISTTLPTDNRHQTKLRNFTRPTIFELGTQSNLNPTERLGLVARNYQHIKESFSTKLFLPIVSTFSGSLANTFARVPTIKCVPVCTSNFPGPSQIIGLDGNRQVVELNCCLGSIADVVVVFVSYNGFMRINVTASESVLDRDQVTKMLENICSEIQILHNLAATCDINKDKAVEYPNITLV